MAAAVTAARLRAAAAACLASLVLGTLGGGLASAGITGTEPSDVVLVFDVSNSILLSEDGTNLEFAEALDDIADRVAQVADDLAAGNAEISFVVFGRGAASYPPNCGGLDLNGDLAAIERFETCLRLIADEYRAGADAPVRQRVNTTNTDHVAALTEAAELLPDTSTRSAVIFFTDGAHDPPGTDRDDEDVVARVRPAYAGKSPLAILPVGLGAGASAFEADLTAIFEAFFRDMQPCEGRETFTWPEVVFPSAEAAGAAVALALQEVTCSFTVAPTAVPPTPSPAVTLPPPVIGPPTGVRVLPGDRSLTIQWLPPASGAEEITGYLVQCVPDPVAEPIMTEVGVSTELEAEFTGLEPGARYACLVAAAIGDTNGEWSAASEIVIVLGIPGTPSQPRAEPMNNSARLSVDPNVGGAPVEQYVFECTGASGAVAPAAGSTPSVVVSGLVNGQSYTCVAYAENRVGRSAASLASAAFSPCAGLFECNPWAQWVVGAVVLAAILGAVVFIARTYARRNRVWITAQVDGGDNRPLGWGPEIGIRLDRDDEGWFAALRPPTDAPIKVRYEGKNRFMINASGRFSDVHQGDPASVRDANGGLHHLILRLYRGRPVERKEAPPPADAPTSDVLGARIEGREED